MLTMQLGGEKGLSVQEKETVLDTKGRGPGTRVLLHLLSPTVLY